MEVTTTTTSVLARRAAKYLSKYCAEHKAKTAAANLYRAMIGF